jgi:hypothetical protein
VVTYAEEGAYVLHQEALGIATDIAHAALQAEHTSPLRTFNLSMHRCERDIEERRKVRNACLGFWIPEDQRKKFNLLTGPKMGSRGGQWRRG